MSRTVTYLISVLVLQIMFACRTLSNRTDDVAFICKQEPRKDKFYLYASFQRSVVKDEVHFQLIDDKGRHDLPVSRGGCAEVDKGDGYVQVSTQTQFGLFPRMELFQGRSVLKEVTLQPADRDAFLKCGTLVDSNGLKDIKQLKLGSLDQDVANPIEYGWRLLKGKVEPLLIGPLGCESVPRGSDGFFLYKSRSGYFLERFNSGLLVPQSRIAFSENQKEFCANPDVRSIIAEFNVKLAICDDKIQVSFVDLCESNRDRDSSGLRLVKAVLEDLELDHCPTLDEQAKFNRLNISGENIDNLDPLVGFTGVTTLDAENIGLQNADAVAKMKNLENLWLDSNNLVSLPDLSGLKNLDFLTAPKNKLTNIEGLRHTNTLVHVDLADNQIKDLTPLGSNRQLKNLYVSRNSVTDIEFLVNHPNLEIALLSYNQIDDLRPLQHLKILNRLSVSGNSKIRDFSYIALPPLIMLEADDLPIKNFSFLSNLHSLKTLNVSRSCADLSTLPFLPSLSDLYFIGCSVTDLTPLAKQDRLYILNMSDNKVIDVSPLIDLKGLSVIVLERNPIETKKTTANCPKNAASPGLRVFCSDNGTENSESPNH